MAQWVGQHGSESVGPGSSLVPNIFDFTDICQKFHSNGSYDTVGRTTWFWSGRSGFESRAKYFYDFTDLCQKFPSNGSHDTVGRTTMFWSCRFGFESQLLPTFFNLNITMENCDTPLLCMNSFGTRILKPGMVPLRNFSVLWDKTISTENRVTRPLSYP